MDAVSELSAIEAIRRLKAAYFRAIDHKDWAAYRALFSDDATLDVSGEAHDGRSPPIVTGADAIAAFVSGQLEDVKTVHQGHMDEIDVLDADRARGVWALHDLLIWPEGAPVRRLEGYGHYHEHYVRNQGGWKIASLRLTRLHVDIQFAEQGEIDD